MNKAEAVKLIKEREGLSRNHKVILNRDYSSYYMIVGDCRSKDIETKDYIIRRIYNSEIINGVRIFKNCSVCGIEINDRNNSCNSCNNEKASISYRKVKSVDGHCKYCREHFSENVVRYKDSDFICDSCFVTTYKTPYQINKSYVNMNYNDLFIFFGRMKRQKFMASLEDIFTDLITLYNKYIFLGANNTFSPTKQIEYMWGKLKLLHEKLLRGDDSEVFRIVYIGEDELVNY